MSNKTIVLGLGNPLFKDEGLGVHVIQQLMQEELKSEVELIDGGTDGLYLLGVVEEAENLLIIDAVDADLPAGSIKCLEGRDIPMFLSTRLSSHQLGFQEVLALARLRGRLPRHMVLIGVQPYSLDWGTNLTPQVNSILPEVKKMIYKQINSWLA